MPAVLHLKTIYAFFLTKQAAGQSTNQFTVFSEELIVMLFIRIL